MGIQDWDEPTAADLKEAPDEDTYQKDLEATQDYIALDEIRQYQRVNK